MRHRLSTHRRSRHETRARPLDKLGIDLAEVHERGGVRGQHEAELDLDVARRLGRVPRRDQVRGDELCSPPAPHSQPALARDDDTDSPRERRTLLFMSSNAYARPSRNQSSSGIHASPR